MENPHVGLQAAAVASANARPLASVMQHKPPAPPAAFVRAANEVIASWQRPDGEVSLSQALVANQETVAPSVEALRELARQSTGSPIGMDVFRAILSALLPTLGEPWELPAAPVARVFHSLDAERAGGKFETLNLPS